MRVLLRSSASDAHSVSVEVPPRRYQKGQHVICAAPRLLDQHLKAAGSPGLVIDPSKIIWTPYNPEREYEK